MLDKFLSYNNDQKVLKKPDKLLIAVSGGIDSMVLVDLMLKAGYTFGIAHINHKLRGADSDDDEKFVSNFCKDNQIEFYSKSVPLSYFEKGNLQEKARQFRYEWFNEILETYNFDWICTAHHADDEVETFFANVMRGSGLNGLSGIEYINTKVLRPLLFAKREEIETYASAYDIQYREDASNQSNKYLRNRIRHQLIPLLNELDARSQSGLYKTIINIKSSKKLLDFLVASHTWIIKTKDGEFIDINKIPEGETGNQLLFELLKKYHFDYLQCENINDRSTSNATYLSSTHIVIVQDKHVFIYSSQVDDSPVLMELKVGEAFDYKGSRYYSKIVFKDDILEFDKDSIYLDAKLLQHSVKVRNWEAGDKLKPLGMEGKYQSIQDIFTNKKLNVQQKKNTLLLESQGKIVAILCWKISDDYKITESTKDVLVISTSEAE